MKILAKKGIEPNKNWVKILKADMKLDGKEAKLKSKALEKSKK